MSSKLCSGLKTIWAPLQAEMWVWRKKRKKTQSGHASIASASLKPMHSNFSSLNPYTHRTKRLVWMPWCDSRNRLILHQVRSSTPQRFAAWCLLGLWITKILLNDKIALLYQHIKQRSNKLMKELPRSQQQTSSWFWDCQWVVLEGNKIKANAGTNEWCPGIELLLQLGCVTRKCYVYSLDHIRKPCQWLEKFFPPVL